MIRDISNFTSFCFSDDSTLDEGEALKELLKLQEMYLGSDFHVSMVILGGMGLAIHYELLRSLNDGVPLVMAYGLPRSGKSLAVKVAMSLRNERSCIGGNSMC